ncbi:hypothetical protein V6N13_080006 [Hibiscus sabdariffa]
MALPFETQNSVSCSSLSAFTSLLFPPKISSQSNHKPGLFHCSLGETVVEPKAVATAETLLLNAVQGHDVERPLVWLMRQAGGTRRQKMLIFLLRFHSSHGKFSSLMGLRSGYLQPIAASADVDQVREFNPEESVPCVGEALTLLQEVLHSLRPQWQSSLYSFRVLDDWKQIVDAVSNSKTHPGVDVGIGQLT